MACAITKKLVKSVAKVTIDLEKQRMDAEELRFREFIAAAIKRNKTLREKI